MASTERRRGRPRFDWLYGGMDLLVRTEHGAVRGVAEDGVSVFKGIPYAAALSGPRRFQAPAAPARWDGLRDASAYSASVPQPALMGGPALWRPGANPDCLTVNVWTPDRGGHLPVLVWFHGGAFLGGGTDDPTYDGTALARLGLVVVTVNYRVGYEGFGWVEDAPANRGLLDQLAALRWVRDNIISFGGNPDNVTIAGQSAGASSVLTLLAGAGRRGLFRRVIAQSAAAMFWEEQESRKASELVIGQFGVPATAAALAQLPTEDIHLAQQDAMTEMRANRAAWTNALPYAVVLDGELLSEPPWTVLRGGAGQGVDLLTGFTADEARTFTEMLPPAAIDPAALARDLRLPPSVLAEYRAGYPEISDPDLYSLLMSDQLFRMPSLWCAESHAGAGGRSFLYEFTWPTPTLGACHGAEVPFVFGTPDSPLAQGFFGGVVPESFDELSSAMRDAWASFAAFGDPGWPGYRTRDRRTRIFGLPQRVESDPAGPSRRIWQRHFPDQAH